MAASVGFWVVMLKRKDRCIYADLHKTDGRFYLTEEDAARVLEGYDEDFKPHYHVVSMVALLEEDYDELLKETQP